MMGLAGSCHPGPTAVVTVGTAILARASGHHGSGLAAVTATVLASQLTIGWHNDWLDAPRDAAVGRADKPIVRGDLPRRTVGVAAILAALTTVGVATLTGRTAAAVATIALCCGLAYNGPLKSHVLSVLPYAVSFACLPAFIIISLPGPTRPPWWLLAAGGCLGAGAHFANVLADLADDAHTGVRGLPHRLGANTSTTLASLFLAAAGALLVFGPGRPVPAIAAGGFATANLVMAAGWYAQRRSSLSHGAFYAVLVAGLIDVVLLLVSGAVT